MDEDDVDGFGADMDEGDEPVDEWGEEAVGETAAALYGKHRNSTSPESRQVCAVLDAVMVAIQEQELQPTATAVFAAVLSSLQHASLRETPEVRAAETRRHHASASRTSPCFPPVVPRAGHGSLVHGA
jgi:hypothetical protein